jgi:transitional endoplasmic reticulum ATPase
MKIHIKKKPLATDVKYRTVSQRNGRLYRCRHCGCGTAAVMLALCEHIEKYKEPKEAKDKASELKISMQHLRDAMKKSKTSVSSGNGNV